MTRRKTAAKRGGLLIPEDVEIPHAEPHPYREAAVIAADAPIPSSEIEPWFEIVVAGHPVRFGFVSSEAILEAQGGEPTHAVTWAENGVVVFDRSLKKNRDALAVVLLHELVHVATGAAYSSGGICKLIFGAQSDEEAGDREEALASYVSDKLAGPLVLGGLFRLPKIPK